MNSKFSSKKNFSSYNDDLPTAAKSKLTDFSPRSYNKEVSQFNIYTPKASSNLKKLQQFSRSIDDLIGIQKQKNQIGKDGVNQVQKVNMEALQYLGQHSFPSNSHGYDEAMFSKSKKPASFQAFPEQKEARFMVEELASKKQKNDQLEKMIQELEYQNGMMKNKNYKTSEVPQEILRELSKLEGENKALRRQTIELMRKNQ